MKATNHNPHARREQVTVQAMGAETLLYDDQRHMAFCLNATASAVWRLADGTRGVAEVARAASIELGAAIGDDVVLLALNHLRDSGLIATSDGSNAAGLASQVLSRRTMLARLGIGAAALLPVVASIVAPTAAQAYSGCVDCSVAGPRRLRRSNAPLGDPSE